jgi:hypothetical protein
LRGELILNFLRLRPKPVVTLAANLLGWTKAIHKQNVEYKLRIRQPHCGPTSIITPLNIENNEVERIERYVV